MIAIVLITGIPNVGYTANDKGIKAYIADVETRQVQSDQTRALKDIARSQRDQNNRDRQRQYFDISE